MTHTQTQGTDGAGTKTAGEAAPDVSKFHINAPGGPNIYVEGNDWFVHAHEHAEYREWAEARLAYANEQLRELLKSPRICQCQLSGGFHDITDGACEICDKATPAPAATPGVPDSLRALSEAACPGRFKAIRGLHEYAVATEAKGQKGPLNSADADFAAASANFVRALISAETTATPYGWTYIWTSDDCDGGAVEQKFSRTKPGATNPYISDIVPLFASHPAGQGAGQGELIRSLQIELSIAQGANRALKEWIKGYRIKGRFQALGQLPAGQAGDAGVASAPQRVERPFAYCCNMDPATCDCANPNHGTALFEVKQSAPNSTRTGADDLAERLRREIGEIRTMAADPENKAAFCELTVVADNLEALLPAADQEGAR